MRTLAFLLLAFISFNGFGQTLAEKYMWKNLPDTSFVEEINGKSFEIELAKWDSLIGYIYVSLPDTATNFELYYNAIKSHFELNTDKRFLTTTTSGKTRDLFYSKEGFVEIKRNSDYNFYLNIQPSTDPITGMLYMYYNGENLPL